MRRDRGYFLLFALAALALRLLFFWKLRLVQGDSLVYGDLAKNLIQHHAYGFSESGGIRPTLIRLPGYPAFLALVWLFAGVEHYDAVMLVQIALDVATCFVVAALAFELAGGRAARWAFALTALCPFLANYAATPLTETLEVFFTALAFYCAARACRAADDLRWWSGCGAAVAACILLRPDGGLVLAALGVYFAVRLARTVEKKRVFAAGVLVALFALAPLAPWALRNWRVFHVFEPLAPKSASDPGEVVTYGYIGWLKTWVAEFSDVYEFAWPVAGAELDEDNLPARAWDSPQQRDRTIELIEEYNDDEHVLEPELDAKFAALARERIAGHRFRYYVGLPALRLADMWLRPRTEALPVEARWWDFELDPRDAAISIAYGVLNLLYLAAAALGVLTRRVRLGWLLILFVVLRSALLWTVDGPESRYTLECFPVLLVFAAAWLARESGVATPAAE